MKLKCKTCKYYDFNNKYCNNFKQHIQTKKSCFAYVEKIQNAIDSSFKFLQKGGSRYV